jgi:hypothetical protein
MKQHDYIFHPDPYADGEWIVQGMDLENECVERSEGPLIVLTLQELQDLWNAAKDRANALQMGHPADTKIFEAYLESKGIIIKTDTT